MNKGVLCYYYYYCHPPSLVVMVKKMIRLVGLQCVTTNTLAQVRLLQVYVYTVVVFQIKF
jgi:hypothetical protein